MSVFACALLVLALIMLGMGIPFAFLAASLAFALTTGLSTGNWGSTAWYSLESFSLLAVPLFMFAGTLMERTGIARALMKFAEKITGRGKKGGGLCNVIPVFSALFGALCGSGLATASTVSSMIGPTLEEKGYKKSLIYSLAAASCPLGYMIPPNMNAVIFAKVANASVADLFIATVPTAIVWLAAYLFINHFLVPKYYDPAYDISEEETEAMTAIQKRAANIALVKSLIPAFLMPVIILGGIYGGIFTATEAGAVGCLYGIIVGLLVFRSMKMRDVFDIASKTAISLGTMMITFPFTMIFTRIMVTNGVPKMITNFITGIIPNKYVIILMITIVLFIAGFFLDGNIILLVITPLLLPTAQSLGMSTIQYGVLVFVALGVAGITPPMAVPLFTCARIGGTTVEEMMKPLMAYLVIVCIPILLLVAYVPAISDFLPALLR